MGKIQITSDGKIQLTSDGSKVKLVVAACDCLDALGYASVKITVRVTGTDTTNSCNVSIDRTFTKTWTGAHAACDNLAQDPLPGDIGGAGICNRPSFDDGGHHFDDSTSGYLEAGYTIDCLENTMDLHGAISLVCAYCIDGLCGDRSHSPCGQELNAFRLAVPIGNYSFSDNFTGSGGSGSYDYTIEVSIAFS